MTHDPITLLTEWKPSQDSIAAEWPKDSQRALLSRITASTSRPLPRPPQRRRFGGRRALSLTLALAALAAITVVTITLHDATSARPPVPSALGFSPKPIGSQPFTGARVVTLSQASHLTGYPIPAPSTSLANPAGLSKVWYATLPTDEGGRSVELDYLSTGVAIDYTSPPAEALTDSLGVYTKMARSLDTSVQTVHGVPALVVGATGANGLDSDHGQPGFVDMVLNGTHIVVMGSYPAQDLVTIAESIPGPNRVTASS